MKQKANIEAKKKLISETFSADEIVHWVIFLDPTSGHVDKPGMVIGEPIEMNGEFYHVFRTTYENDSFHIYAVLDHESKAINEIMEQYASASNDLPVESHQIQSNSGLLKEFCVAVVVSTTITEGWCSTISYGKLTCSLLAIVSLINTPPPKFLFS